MDLTSTFFRNISSFIGDFSGFLNEDDKNYLQSCELYNIDDCTQRTLSYVINFRDDQIYKAFGNILFSKFDKSLFEDRKKNGIVYSYTFQSEKVVLHLHSTTNTFHIQGKGAISWFQEIFKTFAKQLHDECKLCVFSNQASSNTENSVNANVSESFTETLQCDINQMSTPSVKDDTKDSDTKQTLYLSTLSSNTMRTSTPRKNDNSDNQLYEDMLTNYNLSPINSTSNESHIQQEINTLKEMVVSLYKQINEKQTLQDQQTQCSTSYRDASTQTTDSMMPSKPKTISRHTETSVINTKEIYIQTDSAPLFIPKAKNSHTKSLQTKDTMEYDVPSKTHKIKPSSNTNMSCTPNIKPRNTLLIGSSILKSIKTKGLTNTDVCTNRGATIDKLIDILQKKDLSQYKTVIVHIGGNDFHNGDSLNIIYEKYESLLCQLRVMCQPDTVIMVSGIPPRYGVNVHGLNMMLDELCENLNLQFIDHNHHFYDQNGSVNSHLFHADGIHLTNKGTSAFLRSVNDHVKILKRKPVTEWYCSNCGESGHNVNTCKHGQKVLCFTCNNYGHKEKFCNFYTT